MRTKFLLILALSTGLAVAASSCGRKTDAKGELQKAANALAASEPAPPAAPAPSQPNPSLQPAPAAAGAPAPASVPSQQMNQALAAYQAGNLEDAVTRLQKLRATPVMSPQQRIVVNDAIAAVMRDIYEQAAKGDSRAIQAVRQYEKMQTQPR